MVEAGAMQQITASASASASASAAASPRGWFDTKSHSYKNYHCHLEASLWFSLRLVSELL